MKDIYLKFLEQYYRISNTIIRFQNIPLSFNGSIPLRPASIHLIDEIQNHPDANMTEIAQNLGITKGAVSQMVKELEGKGLVKRQRSDRDGRAMHFKLTRAGEKVYDGHAAFFNDLYERVEKKLESYSVDEVAHFEEIVSIIEDMFRHYRKTKGI